MILCVLGFSLALNCVAVLFLVSMGKEHAKIVKELREAHEDELEEFEERLDEIEGISVLIHGRN